MNIDYLIEKCQEVTESLENFEGASPSEYFDNQRSNIRTLSKILELFLKEYKNEK